MTAGVTLRAVRLGGRGNPVGIPDHANTRGPSPLPVETVAALLNWPQSRLQPWHELCESDVTSVDVCNRIIRPDDVFEIDPSGSTREATGSAVRNNLVLASAANL
jgi:hypothetical protein